MNFLGNRLSVLIAIEFDQDMMISGNIFVLGTAILHGIDPGKNAFQVLGSTGFKPHLAQAYIAVID